VGGPTPAKARPSPEVSPPHNHAIGIFNLFAQRGGVCFPDGGDFYLEFPFDMPEAGKTSLGVRAEYTHWTEDSSNNF